MTRDSKIDPCQRAFSFPRQSPWGSCAGVARTGDFRKSPVVVDDLIEGFAARSEAPGSVLQHLPGVEGNDLGPADNRAVAFENEVVEPPPDDLERFDIRRSMISDVDNVSRPNEFERAANRPHRAGAVVDLLRRRSVVQVVANAIVDVNVGSEGDGRAPRAGSTRLQNCSQWRREDGHDFMKAGLAFQPVASAIQVTAIPFACPSAPNRTNRSYTSYMSYIIRSIFPRSCHAGKPDPLHRLLSPAR